jgi:hypothetical protein
MRPAPDNRLLKVFGHGECYHQAASGDLSISTFATAQSRSFATRLIGYLAILPDGG